MSSWHRVPGDNLVLQHLFFPLFFLEARVWRVEADCGATELSCREALASGRGDLQPCAVSQDVWGSRSGLLFYMTGDLMGFSPRSSHKSHIQARP